MNLGFPVIKMATRLALRLAPRRIVPRRGSATLAGPLPAALLAALLAGHSGYDVVFPSGAYLQRLMPAGVFRALDKSRLPNIGNLDPAIMQRLAAQDPGNRYAVPYAWGITGIAYDVAKIRARMQRAERALLAVRPHIRKISAGSLVADLASGELCLIIASGGDAMQAQERVRISGSRAQIGYAAPREGAVMWFDVAAIPADAPHPDNAYRFINFLMDAAVAAENTNAIRFPNGNLASQPRVQPELSNAASFPQGAAAARLISEPPRSEPYVRARTRVWTHFRTGQ